MIKKVFERIQSELTALLNFEQKQWLDKGLIKLADSLDLKNDLLMLSAGTRRQLGQLFLGRDVQSLSLQENICLPMHHWTYSDAGRALFILKALLTSPSQSEGIIREYFQQGDDSEIATITRLLSVFKNAESLKYFAREVGRTNSLPVYAALAQYNPYPAEYYSDHEFNQLVLKALFMGVSIDPIIGLQHRANKELSLMCEEYIKERLAAQRSIPADIWLALEPYASPEGEVLLISQLTNDVLEQRYFAVKALQQRLTETRKKLLTELRDREEDARIVQLLQEY